MNRTKFSPNAVQCVMKFNIGNGLFTAQTDGGESFFVEGFNLKIWGKAKIYAYPFFLQYHRQLKADVTATA